VAPTVAELRRILRADGWVAVFWNQRRSSPLTDGYDALLLEHSVEYRALDGHEATSGRIRLHPGLGPIRERSFAHEDQLEWDHFQGRVESSSYVEHGVDDRDAFERALIAIFDTQTVAGA